jgi:uncharacterized protein YgiM (DUF1202 family)
MFNRLALCIVALVLTVGVTADVLAADDYYVTADSLNVRSGAGSSYPVVSKLHRGSRVTDHDRSGDWIRISDRSSPPLWTHSSYLSRLKPTDNKGSVNFEALQRCKSWLLENTGYQFFAETTRVQEYEQYGEYHLRANLLVLTILHDWAEVGFDCTVYVDQDKTVAFMDLKTFASEQALSSQVENLQERRMRWGSDACPALQSWKEFADQVYAGNYSYQIDKSCNWIEKGHPCLRSHRNLQA